MDLLSFSFVASLKIPCIILPHYHHFSTIPLHFFVLLPHDFLSDDEYEKPGKIIVRKWKLTVNIKKKDLQRFFFHSSANVVKLFFFLFPLPFSPLMNVCLYFPDVYNDHGGRERKMRKSDSGLHRSTWSEKKILFAILRSPAPVIT